MIHHVRREELSGAPVRLLASASAPASSEPHVDDGRRARVRALLLEELASDRLLRLARRELARFHGDSVVVHVHPEELALFDPARLRVECELAALDVREDAALTRGGLRMESPRGEVDATLEQRVERMLTLLFGDAP